MAGRSLKGHVAHISTSYLRLLNWIMVAGAVATIVIVFIIKPAPIFPAGWGFIGLGIVTIIAGIFGAISSGQMGCFGIYMMCMLTSSAGLCASWIFIFLKLNTVLEAIEYDLARLKAKQMLRILGAIYFILFCTQLVIFMLACLIQSCGFVDYYEDLEARQPKVSAKQLAKEEAEEEKRRARIEEASALREEEKAKGKFEDYSSDRDQV